MNRVFFFIAEAFRALRRSAAPSLAAIVTVVLTTLLLGVFVPVIKASSTTNRSARPTRAARLPEADATKKQGLGAYRSGSTRFPTSTRTAVRLARPEP